MIRMRPLHCLVFAVMLLAGTAAYGQGEAESVEKFLGRRDQWTALVGARFVLEGRVGVLSSQTLQFDRCDLTFRLKPGTPALPRDTRVVEVTGTLVRDGSRLVFEVDNLRRRDNDLETLRARRSRIDTTRPEAWFALAEWADGRGKFYDDSELRKRAEELREIGLTAESRRLKPDDSAGLLELAKRAGAWNLEQGIGWRFAHDACRIELSRTRRDPANDGATVLAMVMKHLPGASTPLQPDDEPLRQAYEKNSAETYARADSDTRFKLHRALYIEVLLARIERDVQLDGSNGYAIAARISQQLPELEARAETYREKELAYLKGRVTTMSRDQLVGFARKLTDRKDLAEATEVKKQWLRSREPAARIAGPTGLIQLADDYEQLLSDRQTALAVVEGVWNANPGSVEASAWLKDRGRVLDGNRWVPAAAASRPTEDRFAQAIQEGQVLAGMSGEQARAAMGARPSSVVRQASLGKVTELWIYRTEGLVVTLTRDAGDRIARVKEVASLPDDVP